jgi:hypothetical protein
MGNEDDVTKVRFDLYGVLFFLVVLVGIGMGYLFTAQATARDERTKAIQNVCDRVTVLETQYKFISEGIVELKQGQRELVVTLKRNGK